MHKDHLKARKRRIKKINFYEGKIHRAEIRIAEVKKILDRYNQNEVRKSIGRKVSETASLKSLVSSVIERDNLFEKVLTKELNK